MVTKPTILIQCDWEKWIMYVKKEIWVACKSPGNPSINAKVQSQGANPPTCDSEDFSIVYPLRSRTIYIKHKPSNSHYCFLAPHRQLDVHKKGVVSVDVADSSKLGVSSDVSGKLLIWNLTDGEIKQTLEGHVNTVNVCKLFPSGIVCLSGGIDTRLKIWSAESGVCPVTLTGHLRPVTGLAIVDRGRNVISVSKDGTARLWDCGESACLSVLLQTNDVFNCCALGEVPSGTKTAVSSNPREVGTTNKFLLIGSEENRIYGLVVSTRTVLFTSEVDAAVNTIQYINVDHWASGLQNGKIIFHRLADGVALKVIEESNSPVLSSCTLNENLVVGRNDGTVSFLSAKSEDLRLQLTGSDFDPITGIAYSGGDVYVGSRDGIIRVYQIKSFIDQELYRYPNE